MKCLILILTLTPIFMVVNAYEHKDLKCLICQVMVKEFQKAVSNVSDKKTVEVGGYQMSADGNVKKKKKLFVESEVHLSELLDTVCSKLDDYVRATTKDTGKLVLMNLSDTMSSPSMSEVNFVQDGDLNRSLPHICKGIIEEFEDEIIESFVKRSVTPTNDICVEAATLCDKEEDDDDDERDEL